MIHTHCDHWPEACCWCLVGLDEDEQRWQDEWYIPRRMFTRPEEAA